MKYLTLWFVALFGGLSLAGQATKEEMLATPEKTAGVYYAYPAPKEYVATPPPKGYVPFYISHFGRHGSRFLLEETEYTEVLALMEKAEAADALTPLGKDALQRLRRSMRRPRDTPETFRLWGSGSTVGLPSGCTRHIPRYLPTEGPFRRARP